MGIARREVMINPLKELNKDNQMISDGREWELKEADSNLAMVKDHQESEKGKKKDERKFMIPFYKLFVFADSRDIVLMIVGTVAAVANGAVQPLTVLIFGKLINAFGGTQDISGNVVHEVTQVALQFVYLALGAGTTSFLQVTCWISTGERQAARIRNVYLKTILKQEIAYFDKQINTGEVVERISGDTLVIQDAMGEKVGKFIQLTSTFFGGFIVAFSQGWLLTLVMLSTIPPLVFAGVIMSTVITNIASRGQTAYTEAAAVVEQAIGSIRTVVSFTAEKQSLNKYRESLQSAYDSSIQEGLAVGLGMGTVMFLFFCGYSLGIWYGAKLILNEDYTGGNVFSVIFAVLTGSLALGQSSPCITAFAEGRAATTKMFETINRKPEIDAYSTTGLKLSNIRGNIEFRNVHFSYPARPEEQIFSGFSLLIESGTTMALVGESGSGKSTLISLIERFYDPQQGELLIDGVNLKEFQLRWIRGKIGLVSQEPILFASSIRENIAYGKEDATIEEIRVAAALANASTFIDKMPEGIDTMVGECGTQLSGGQKQRIAIARSILKDPRILLLDEATSALDEESERIVQEALDKIMRNRTTVVVAHRLTTVRNSNTIVVLQKGAIVQKGSHSELLKNLDGAYCQLIRLQEMRKELEQSNQTNQDRMPTKTESGRQPSQRVTLPHCISRGRSVGGSSSSQSFSLSFGLPIGIDIQESALDKENIELPPQQPQQVPLRRLAHLNKPELRVLILGTIAAVINGVILPIFGVLLSNVIYTFFEPPPKLKKDAKFYSNMFVILGLVSLFALPAKSYLFGIAGSKLIRRIRLLTFEKVIQMEIGWFDDFMNLSGAIGARLSVEAAAVRSLVGDALAQVVQNVATLITGLIIAFDASWQLSLIILALIPLVGLNGWIQIEFIKGFSADAKMMYEETSQVASNVIGNIRTVASFSAEDKVMELYTKKSEGPVTTGIKQGLISGIGFGISFFLLYCVYATSFYAGARLIQDGKTTFEKVFRVFFALAMAAIGISQSSSVAVDSTKAKFAASSIFAILDRKTKIDPCDDTGIQLEKLKGNIEFKHVSFRYPTRPDVQIFQDLCFAILSGKTVGLVGESGSGKSTAISLLQRFYDPDSGQILLDGTDIRKIQLKWLRKQMGLVSQEPVLFNDTIRANIAYGKEGEATESEILAAAESANAHLFISSLQQGYNTIVGERGAQLSGGQKQRVAIARAVMKEPKILLLDEATSALDAQTERAVQDALDRMMVNRTTVVVTHRLSTIKGCDLIGVVKDGVIIEKGKHEALINIKGGVYASLIAVHLGASS